MYESNVRVDYCHKCMIIWLTSVYNPCLSVLMFMCFTPTMSRCPYVIQSVRYGRSGTCITVNLVYQIDEKSSVDICEYSFVLT